MKTKKDSKQLLFEMMEKVNPNFKKINENDEWLGSKIDDLMEMLRNKRKDNDTYVEGMGAIVEKFGKDVWDTKFDTFRKQLRKWMTSDEANTNLPNAIIDEYEFVTDELY